MATEYKLSYTAQEINTKLGKIDNLATKSEVPTKTSQLTNDNGYLTKVPDEIYEHLNTIDEFVRAFGPVVEDLVGEDVSFDEENIPTSPSVREIATDEATKVKNDLLNGAGGAYDTLKELGDLIDDNADAINALETVASSKVPNTRKINGKALTNDITLALSDLKADSTHRTVTDAEKAAWNAKANTSDIPTKVSQLTNDKNYLTSYTETDPTVPSWAKASTKPSYTKSEVGLGNVDNVKQYSASNPPPYPVTKVNNKTGAITLSASDVGADATGTASSAVSAHNTNTSAHADIREQISQLSSDKVDKNALTLGLHTDGLFYIFVDGTPVGNGIEMPDKIGDVYGNIDSANNIVLKGYMPDGTYTAKFEMDDGTTFDIGTLVLDTNVYYSITKNLTYCTINNSTTQIVKDNSYSATISANSGYTLKSVSVTMGGSAVSVTNGVINIAKVTGNIVITAVAEVAGPAYTNLLPLAVDENGNPFVGTNGEDGYTTNTRLSATTATGVSAENGVYCTGFIPFTNKLNKIRIANATLHSTATHNRLYFYDSSKARVHAVSSFGKNPYFYVEDGIWWFKPNAWDVQNSSYFRFSCGSITSETVITENEEIV